MAMHLLSTPTQCTHCGTVVEDPTVDRCPDCGDLLRERRAPRRIAGVQKRYGGLRFLLGFLRFLGVVSALVGLLVLVFSVADDELTAVGRILVTLGSLIVGVGVFAVAALFDVLLDVEENTRSSFRMQQLMLEQIQGGVAPEHVSPPVESPE
jgi:predicted RNA-binding Zn-ribbon protein involved in translation (DUF1610 family)